MVDHLIYLWAWLLACFAIGAASGALTRRAPAKGGVARWLIWTGLAFVAGALVAGLGALRGAAAMSLESALAAYAAFLSGAAIGTFATRSSLKAHDGWALGLIPAGLVWWGATFVAQPAYQEALHRRLVAVSEGAGVDAAQISVSGRDVRTAEKAAANPQLVAEISRIPGVRQVMIDAAPAPGSPAADSAPASSALQTPSMPPAAEAVSPAAAPARLSAGALTAAECQAALDASVTQDRIMFQPARATITRAAALTLAKAAEIIRRCADDATIEIGGHVHGVGARQENDALARRRAEAAMRYLQREGVGGRRLIAAGQGAAPLEEKSAAPRGAISFTVR